MIFCHQEPYTDYIQAHYDNSYETMGGPDSFVSYGPGWAEAGSAPFKRHKGFTSEGGITAPLIMATFLQDSADTVHGEDHITVQFHRGRAYLRQGNWKITQLTLPFDESGYALYDLQADPGEITDLSEGHP